MHKPHNSANISTGIFENSRQFSSPASKTHLCSTSTTTVRLFVQPSSLVVAFESLKMWLFCILCHLIMEHRCMTQPGSDEMVYRVLLEHANNSAKSSEQSVESETNSASDIGGDKGSNTSRS